MKEGDAAVARGATSLYAANLINLLMNTGHFIILTNILSTSEIGAIAGIQLLVYGFSTLASLSLPQPIMANLPLPPAVTKFIPQFSSVGKNGKASSSLRVSIMILLLIATPLLVFMIGASDLLSSIIFRGEISALWFSLVAIDALIFAMAQLMVGATIGLKKIPQAGLYQTISYIIRYVTAASLVIIGYRVLGVIVAYIFADILLLILTTTASFSLLKTSSDPVPVKTILRYALPLLVASLIVYGITQMDKIFTLTRSLSELGIYNVAVAASTIGAFAPNAITTALVPSLSSLAAANDIKGFRALARSYTRYVSLVAIPMAFGIASISTALVQIFGQQYLPAAVPTMIMSLAVGVTAVSSVYNGQLLSTRGTSSIMMANILGLAVFVALLSVLLPYLGLVGAAWSRGVMYATTAIALMIFTYRYGFFTIDKRAYLSSILASTVMGLPLFAITMMIGGYLEQIAMLPLLIPLGITLYLLTLRALKTFSTEDIEFLINLLPKKLSRLAILAGRLAGVSEYKKEDL